MCLWCGMWCYHTSLVYPMEKKCDMTQQCSKSVWQGWPTTQGNISNAIPLRVVGDSISLLPFLTCHHVQSWQLLPHHSLISTWGSDVYVIRNKSNHRSTVKEVYTILVNKRIMEALYIQLTPHTIKQIEASSLNLFGSHYCPNPDT